MWESLWYQRSYPVPFLSDIAFENLDLTAKVDLCIELLGLSELGI